MTNNSEFYGCPECKEHTSFNIKITGVQEKAVYSESKNGDPSIYQAGAVTVKSHDPDHLECRSCGEILSEDDLVPVEVN